MGVYKKGKSWYIDYWHNGKRYRESVGPGIRRDAERALAKRKVEIIENRIFDKKRQCDFTIEEMVKDYLEFSKRHRRGHRQNKTICKAIVQFFKGQKVRDITASSIEDFKKARLSGDLSGKPVKESTVNRELAALKVMYNRLIRDQKIDFNPMKYVKMLNEEHLQRDRVLSPLEFERLVSESIDYLKPIVTAAYFTAMRKGEILNLTWDKVDLRRKTITLNPQDTKTNRKRQIPMVKEVYDVIRKQFDMRLKFRECEHVFHNQGKPLSDIKDGFRNACKRAEIYNFRFHDLRHTAITRWVKMGLPEKAIMIMSGHKTRKVFDQYTNLSVDDVAKILSNASKQIDRSESQAQ